MCCNRFIFRVQLEHFFLLFLFFTTPQYVKTLFDCGKVCSLLLFTSKGKSEGEIPFKIFRPRHKSSFSHIFPACFLFGRKSRQLILNFEPQTTFPPERGLRFAGKPPFCLSTHTHTHTLSPLHRREFQVDSCLLTK